MAIEKEEILRLAEKIYPYQVKIRRQLHRHPEISFQEFKTTELLKAELKRHGLETRTFGLKTGLVALINRRKKRAAAIRCDIDALPVTERTGLDFASRNRGVMHACGHDIHMAVVLGTAIILNSLKNRLPDCVKCIFQPAEEEPPGGAKSMIEAGVLKNPAVKIVFGLHVDPTLAVGRISLRDGPTMAMVHDFDIIIRGRGGHAAKPHEAVDAVAVACEVVEAMQKIVSREVDPLKPAVITFGLIQGGSARNVIADEVILKGTARTLWPQNGRLLPRLIRRTLDGITRARGAEYQLEHLSGYPVLENNPHVNGHLRSAWRELFGRRAVAETPMVMGGEDFAYFARNAPAAMFRLGIKNKKIKADKPWHSPEFIADERSIFYGTALLSSAICRFGESPA